MIHRNPLQTLKQRYITNKNAVDRQIKRTRLRSLV
jgi:hypothetical protein